MDLKRTGLARDTWLRGISNMANRYIRDGLGKRLYKLGVGDFNNYINEVLENETERREKEKEK